MILSAASELAIGLSIEAPVAGIEPALIQLRVYRLEGGADTRALD